jgi:hypothetical protein
LGSPNASGAFQLGGAKAGIDETKNPAQGHSLLGVGGIHQPLRLRQLGLDRGQFVAEVDKYSSRNFAGFRRG